LAVLYVACWVYSGLAGFSKGQDWLFGIGFVVPFLAALRNRDAITNDEYQAQKTLVMSNGP
jgi:hypothetical protein